MEDSRSFSEHPPIIIVNTSATKGTLLAVALSSVALALSAASWLARSGSLQPNFSLTPSTESPGLANDAIFTDFGSQTEGARPALGSMRESVAASGSFAERSAFDDLVEEVEQLRREVARLSQAQERPSVNPEISDPLAAARDMDRLHSQLRTAPDRELLQELIERRVVFLDRYSDHEEAESQLLGLVSNSISAGETGTGLNYLSQFAARVGMSQAVEFKERATLLLAGGRYREAKATWVGLSNDGSLPENVQADSAFWAAYTEMQHGHPGIARNAFEELIARFEGSEDSQTVNSINSAKSQLESLP